MLVMMRDIIDMSAQRSLHSDGQVGKAHGAVPYNSDGL